MNGSNDGFAKWMSIAIAVSGAAFTAYSRFIALEESNKNLVRVLAETREERQRDSSRIGKIEMDRSTTDRIGKIESYMEQMGMRMERIEDLLVEQRPSVITVKKRKGSAR